MKYNPATCPGPGDEATWPAYSGHQNDPRAPEPPPWDAMTREQRREQMLASHFLADDLIEMYLDQCADNDYLRGQIARFLRKEKL